MYMFLPLVSVAAYYFAKYLILRRRRKLLLISMKAALDSVKQERIIESEDFELAYDLIKNLSMRRRGIVNQVNKILFRPMILVNEDIEPNKALTSRFKARKFITLANDYISTFK